MKCLNRMCIFQENCTCTKDEIEITWQGLCKNMIPARVTSNTLDSSKEYIKLILKIDESYHFDAEYGMVTMLDDARQFYDNDYE